MASWEYDDPELRSLITQGYIDLCEEEIAHMMDTFIEWFQDEEHSILRNSETGEHFVVLNRKRGNEAYAQDKYKRMRRIEKNIKGMKYDMPIKGFRTDRKRLGHFMLITPTFWHVPFDLVSAWRACKGEGCANILNRFRTQLGDLLGTSYGAFTVKEAQRSGHPAPHILIIADKPFTFFSSKDAWRMEDAELLGRIKRLWERCCYDALEELGIADRVKGWKPTETHRYLCNVDVQGIIGNRRRLDRKRSVISYAMKYMIKTVNPTNRTALMTHVMQKLFNMRDPMSDAFKHRLNSSTPISRLDLVRNELKKVARKIRDIEALEGAFGFLLSNYPERLRRLYTEEDALLRELPPVEWHFVKSVKTLDEYLAYVTENGGTA